MQTNVAYQRRHIVHFKFVLPPQCIIYVLVNVKDLGC